MTDALLDGANMGEVIRFLSKSERERARFIQEARAIYDSIFPPADPAGAGQEKPAIGRSFIGHDGGSLS